jgi:hypothetical protein
MGQKTSIPGEITTAQMWWMGASFTFVAWAFGLGLAAHHGRGFSHASYASAVAAFCGLAGWVAYHIVTRRNNALGGFMIFALCPSHSLWQYPLSVSSAVHLLLLQITLGLLIGLTSRGLNALKPRTRAAGRPEPLYDAQLDQVG